MFQESVFKNRQDAGLQLVEALQLYRQRSNVLVLGIPRGGVEVAFEIALKLHVLLDICMVKKIRVPGHEELAMGALSEGGFYVINHDVLKALKISDEAMQEEIKKAQKQLRDQMAYFRQNHKSVNIKNRTVIVVDDGLATGASMNAAVLSLKGRGASEVVVAVPVASQDAVKRLESIADKVVALLIPPGFESVGDWYHDFEQTRDEEVIHFLEQERKIAA